MDTRGLQVVGFQSVIGTHKVGRAEGLHSGAPGVTDLTLEAETSFVTKNGIAHEFPSLVPYHCSKKSNKEREEEG